MDPEKLRELEGAWIQSPRDWRREWHFRLSGHVATYSPLRIPSAQEQGLLKGSKDLADKKPELLVLLHQGSEHCSLHHSQAAHMCESNSMGSNRLFWTPLALTHKCTFKYTNNFLISKKNKKKKNVGFLSTAHPPAPTALEACNAVYCPEGIPASLFPQATRFPSRSSLCSLPAQPMARAASLVSQCLPSSRLDSAGAKYKQSGQWTRVLLHHSYNGTFARTVLRE